MSKLKPKRLSKSWDDYVAEAQRPPLEFELGPDEIITIEQPTGGDSITINMGLRLNNPEMVAPALFGSDNGAKVLEKYRTAPGGVFMELVADIFGEFNMATNGRAEESVGDTEASSS